MTPVLKYPGAKWRIAKWIIDFMPKHKVYLEPFFGSGAVFFNKEPAHIETINDIDGDVVNFFKICQERTEEFAELLELTPWSRQEYYEAYLPSEDDLERARRFAIRCYQAFGAGQLRQNGWKHGVSPTAPNPAKIWNRLPEQIRFVGPRLIRTQIENRPALELITIYNNPDTLLYVDPPYLPETRSKTKQYKNEMTEGEHVELLKTLKASKSNVILSGYDSGLYNDFLKGWQKAEKKTTCENGKPRTEVIWINYPVQEQMRLYDDAF